MIPVIIFQYQHAKMRDPASAEPRPMTNGIWQSLRLVLVNAKNVYAKFYQNVTHSSRVMASFMFVFCCFCFLFLFFNFDLGKTSTSEKLHLAIPWAKVCSSVLSDFQFFAADFTTNSVLKIDKEIFCFITNNLNIIKTISFLSLDETSKF